MDELVRATLSVAQAQAVADGLDLSSRIAMGQIDEIATLVRMHRIRVRDDSHPSGGRDATLEEADAIETHARAIASLLGHRGGSFGIGSQALPIEAKRQYEFKKVVEKALADAHDPGGTGNKHDGLVVRYVGEEEPSARMARRGEA